MNIDIKNNTAHPQKSQHDIAKVFVEGFYDWLSSLNSNKQTLIKVFEGSFNLGVFYVAYKDDLPVGITACTDNKQRAVSLQKKKFIKELGLIKGLIFYFILKKEFEYRLPYGDNVGYIEFVAVLPEAKGKGVAKKLIQYIFENTEYTEYILEYADNNQPAKVLYEKIGFEEFERKKQKNANKAGFKERVYMKINP